MASLRTLLNGWPYPMKCPSQAPDGPSPCFSWAMLDPGGKGPRCARLAGCCWCTPWPRLEPSIDYQPAVQAPWALGSRGLVGTRQARGASAPICEDTVGGECSRPCAC